MVRALEGDPGAERTCRGAQAPMTIVALAGGVSGSSSDDPPVSRLKEASFRRTIAAAELARAHREARLVLSGGSGRPDTEADLMRRLAISLGVPPDSIILESRSRNTAESAVLVAGILEDRGPRLVHLVTSALHMPRAAGSFEAQGVRVCRHPVDWRQVPLDFPAALLPQISALEKSTAAAREVMGRLWYRVTERLSPAPGARP